MEKPVLQRKPQREFFRIAPGAAQTGGAAWVPVPGLVGRIDRQTLADTLDAATRTGSRPRLACRQPGATMAARLIHDFNQEVFIVAGDSAVGCDAQGQGSEGFDAYTFACRPP